MQDDGDLAAAQIAQGIDVVVLVALNDAALDHAGHGVDRVAGHLGIVAEARQVAGGAGGHGSVPAH